jgi:hypothetical protein
MARFLLLGAVIGLFASASAAEDQLVFKIEQPEWVRGTTKDSQVKAAFLEFDGAGARPAQDVGLTLFEEDLPPPSVEENNQAATELSEESERPYHSVCDCNCHVRCLDEWCVCDIVCGHTDDPVMHGCESAVGTTRLTEDGDWLSNDACCDVSGPPIDKSLAAGRFGWWGVSSDGSQVKTGEFQDLSPSPFWDVDAISSDGVRTWDFALSGLDQEANDANILYFGPNLSAELDFERYIRRLEHEPLAGLDLAPGQVPPPGPEGDVIVDDLDIGEDYAIRVEELKAKAQGKLMDHVTWRVNVWGQRKFGERQSNATAHCFNVLAPAAAGATGNTCHVLSQRQEIDWTTVEFQPVLEAKFENFTVEYSRTMRSFGQDDELITRQYTRFGFSPASGALGPDFAYALVPDNMTEIDRLKMSTYLNEKNKLYANLYHGDTNNEFRDMTREFSGYDLRLINDALDDMTLTAYASRYDEETGLPAVILDTPPFGPTPVPPAVAYDRASLRHPVDYNRTRVGLKSSWQPFGDRGPRRSNYGMWDGTSLASGYEYYLLERDFVTWNVSPVPFTQPNTKRHQIEFGPATRWSRTFDTFTRYKVRFTDDPLIGVSERAEDEPGAQGTFNTNQPEQEHIVEIGGTWSAAANLVTTAQVEFFNSWHDSQFANFSEDDTPMMVTVWYAPTHKLSLTAGYAFFSNWIDQDITLGANRGDPTEIETTRWDYNGENHLVSLSTTYLLTPRVQLVSAYEFNRGSNTFDIPPSPNPGVDWTTVEQVADVIVETHRVSTGFDWQPYRDMNVYARYILFDYNDISANLYTGTAHMALIGATRTW